MRALSLVTASEVGQERTVTWEIIVCWSQWHYRVLLFVNLWLGFIVKMYRSGRSSAFHEPELFRLKMLCAITFVSVFIIHSTSAGFLHPSSVLYGVIWYSLIFAFGNHLVNTRLAVSE